MNEIFDKSFLNDLLVKANKSVRKRQNYDLRNSITDTSQRMLNALLPLTNVPIHQHDDTSETVICLSGKLEEIFYEPVNVENNEFREIARFVLEPKNGSMGMQIPAGVWHSIKVLEPSVIFEAKDGIYKG